MMMRQVDSTKPPPSLKRHSQETATTSWRIRLRSVTCVSVIKNQQLTTAVADSLGSERMSNVQIGHVSSV